MDGYQKSDSTVWSGRIDSTSDRMAFRYHQSVEIVDLAELPKAPSDNRSFCLIGFRCDEGVRRNQGRVGAYDAPIAIRKELAKLPANFIDQAQLIDAGDITCSDGDMEKAQEHLADAVRTIITLGHFPLVLGGGHEVVYGHYSGLRKALDMAGARRPPLLLNFDAHLDLRPCREYGTSGTSFDQIATEHLAHGRPFDYLCLGLQTTGNTRSLYARADELGVDYFNEKDITEANKNLVLERVLSIISHHDDVYLTLDMDVLSAAYAPGVSSPQPFGMEPEMFLYLVKEVLYTSKVRSIDIAEVSPRYDDDNQTAKLAAIVLYSIMNVLSEQGS